MRFYYQHVYKNVEQDHDLGAPDAGRGWTGAVAVIGRFGVGDIELRAELRVQAQMLFFNTHHEIFACIFTRVSSWLQFQPCVTVIFCHIVLGLHCYTNSSYIGYGPLKQIVAVDFFIYLFIFWGDFSLCAPVSHVMSEKKRLDERIGTGGLTVELGDECKV